MFNFSIFKDNNADKAPKDKDLVTEKDKFGARFTPEQQAYVDEIRQQAEQQRAELAKLRDFGLTPEDRTELPRLTRLDQDNFMSEINKETPDPAFSEAITTFLNNKEQAELQKQEPLATKLQETLQQALSADTELANMNPASNEQVPQMRSENTTSRKLITKDNLIRIGVTGVLTFIVADVCRNAGMDHFLEYGGTDTFKTLGKFLSKHDGQGEILGKIFGHGSENGAENFYHTTMATMALISATVGYLGLKTFSKKSS